MNLTELAAHWNEFGKTDPLWAVLTQPGTENNRWDVGRFFETGRHEIAHVFHLLAELAIPVQRIRALDFGCAVGRLTQALCPHFDECYGVDIAPAMIEQAIRYNQFGGKCRYFLNRTNDLAQFESNSFSFIYTNIVLQHMKPEYTKNYIQEFLRLLSPAGVVVFQLPTGRQRHLPPAPGQGSIATRTTFMQPLPADACHARITPLVERICENGGIQLQIPVKLQNTSQITWPSLGAPDARFQVFLGNHWYDRKGKLITQDDGRVPLPSDVKPGEEIELTVPVVTPRAPGKYALGFDLVQEEVAWFKEKGQCLATSVPVEVKESPKQPVASFTPRMEMYGIPRDEVVEVIRQAGGKLLHAREDQAAGPGLESFTYFAAKLERPR
jgi:SAM-dependent methyltransferase